MENRANYALVGLFTVLVVVSLFGFIYWMNQYGDRGELVPLDIHIPGSVNGLSEGSQVLFNGIRIGSVKSMELAPDNPNVVIVHTTVQANAPIYEDTRAELGFLGLTGAAFIELKGGDTKSPSLLTSDEEQPSPPVITADPSAVTDLLATAKDIAQRVDSAVTEIETFVVEARQPINNTLDNVETFSKALADNADGIDTFLRSVTALSESVSVVGSQLETTVGAANRIITAVDPDQVATFLENAAVASTDIRRATTKIGDTVVAAQAAIDTFRSLGTGLTGTVSRVDSILASIEGESIGTAIERVSRLAQDATDVVGDIKTVTGRFGERGEDFDTIMDGARTTVENLTSASERISTVTAKVDAILGEGTPSELLPRLEEVLADAGRLVASADPAKVGTTVDNLARASEEARAAVEEVRQLTGRFDERSGDFDAIISNVQKTAENLNEASSQVSKVTTKVDAILGEGTPANLLPQIEEVLTKVNTLMASTDPAKVGLTVENLARASEDARAAAADVAGVTGKLDERSGDVDAIITDVQQLASRLNAASVRVDGVLAKVDSFLGDGDASQLLTNAEATLNAFRRTADNLNARITPITANLERFSGQGLRDVEALVSETRRSIQRIESAITSLERDPQRVIFGGDNVKTYDGRQRR